LSCEVCWVDTAVFASFTRLSARDAIVTRDGEDFLSRLLSSASSPPRWL
jgi:hypothetical protein